MEDMRNPNCGTPSPKAFDQANRLPLSNTQLAMWKVCQRAELEAVNIALSIRIAGPIQIEALEMALNDVTRRHNILRLSITAECDQVFQSLHETSSHRVQLISMEASRASIMKVFESRSRRFALDKELPLEARLIVNSPERHTLILILHPLAFDPRSASLLVDDICFAYYYRCIGIAPKWSCLALQYSDYLSRRRGVIRERVALTYWEGILKENKRPDLKLSSDCSTSDYDHGAIRLNPGLHRKLLALQKLTRTTLLMMLHAVVSITINGLWKLDKFLIAAEMPCRRRPGEHIIGPIGNRLYLQTEVRDTDTFRSLLMRVRDKHFEAYRHSELEWGDIVNATYAPSGAITGPAAVMISCQKYNRRTLFRDVRGSRFILEPLLPFMAGCDLAFDLIEFGLTDRLPEGILGKIRCNGKSFDKKFLPIVSRRFLDIFGAILFDDCVPIKEIVDDIQHVDQGVASEMKEYGRQTHEISSAFPTSKMAFKRSDSRRQLLSRAPDYVGSQHTTQQRILEIWEDALKLRRIGIHDDLMDLGGNQNIFDVILEQIANAYEIILAPRSLEPGITVYTLSQELVDNVPLRPMIQINTGDPARKRPWWFLHGDIGGRGLYCRELRRFLAKDLPFYALPPSGINGSEIPRSVEEMADKPFASVLSGQPTGPYLLGGYCIGGLVALEIADRLVESGAQVSALVVIDTYLPTGPYPPIDESSSNGSASDYMNNGFARYAAAGRRYTPRAFSGQLHLLCRKERMFPAYDPIGNWRVMASDLRVQWISGGHGDCLTRHIDSLGAAIHGIISKS